MFMSTKPSQSELGIKKFMKTKKCLVVDKNKISRASLRKLMMVMEMSSENITCIESFKEAENFIKREKPNFIFTEYKLGDFCGADLIHVHKESNPNRLEANFFLVSEKNNPTIHQRVLEDQMDSYVAKPFTLDMLQKSLTSSILTKLNPSNYIKKVNEAISLVNLGKYDDAEKMFLDLEADPKCDYQVYYYLAMINKRRQDIDEAKEFYLKSLESKPDHYLSINGILDMYLMEKDYVNAFKMLMELKNHHFITPTRQGIFVKLSLMNQQYDQIVDLFEQIMKLDPQDRDIEGQKSMAAGLSICGRYYLTNKPKEGEEILKKAAEFAGDNVDICRSILSALFEAKRPKLAQEIFQRLSDTNQLSKDDLTILELEVGFHTGNVGDILQKAMILKSKGMNNSKIYEIIIMCNVKLERKKEIIQDFIFEASRKYPQDKAKFEKLGNP